VVAYGRHHNFKFGIGVDHVNQHGQGQGNRSHNVLAAENAITRQWIVISTSNVAENITLEGAPYNTLSRSVAQIKNKKHGELLAYLMTRSNENGLR